MSFDGRIRTKDTRGPPHASPWWSRIYRVAWLIPGLASGCLLTPRKHFPSLLLLRRKTLSISRARVLPGLGPRSRLSLLSGNSSFLGYVRRILLLLSSDVAFSVKLSTLLPAPITFPFSRGRRSPEEEDGNPPGMVPSPEPYALRLILDLASDLCIFASHVGIVRSPLVPLTGRGHLLVPRSDPFEFSALRPATLVPVSFTLNELSIERRCT